MQDNEKVKTTIYVDKDLLKKFKIYCVENDESVSGFVTKAMEKVLENK